MHAEVVAGLGLAVACALGTNLGGLWKRKGALATDDVDVRRPVRTAAALFRSKWWTIGWLVAAVGWALHVGALALAPISLAQAVIAGGLVLLGVVAERWFGFELQRRQWLVLILVAFGMAFLAATGGATSAHSKYELTAIAAFEAGAVVVATACVLACRLGWLCDRHGVLLGAAAGLLFGLADVSVKAVTGESGGLLALLSPWTFTALVAGIAAFYAAARSLQIGDGLAVITATAAAANVLGILGGILVFGDPLGSDPWVVGGRIVAFGLVVVAVALFPAPVRAQEAIAQDAAPDQPSPRDPDEEGRAPAGAGRALAGV